MPFGQGSIVNNAHSDYTGNWSKLGVIGTLGTSDIGGTALTLPMAVDAHTGAAYTLPISTYGSIFTSVIAIGTTVGSIPATALVNRRTIIAYNVGTSTVFLGGANMVGTGIPGIPIVGTSFTPSMDIGTTILYGVGTVTGGTIVIMEVS